jgi:hypothetical protein
LFDGTKVKAVKEVVLFTKPVVTPNSLLAPESRMKEPLYIVNFVAKGLIKSIFKLMQFVLACPA